MTMQGPGKECRSGIGGNHPTSGVAGGGRETGPWLPLPKGGHTIGGGIMNLPGGKVHGGRRGLKEEALLISWQTLSKP